MNVSPDIAGFVAAQERLREEFGLTVVFHWDLPAVYPPGTPLDPETGTPYDPTIVPTSTPGGSASVTDVSVAHRPLGLSRRGVASEDTANALGRMEDGEAALIIGKAKFDYHNLSDADWVEVHEDEWEITSWDADAVGTDETQRYVFYIRKR